MEILLKTSASYTPQLQQSLSKPTNINGSVLVNRMMERVRQMQSMFIREISLG